MFLFKINKLYNNNKINLLSLQRIPSGKHSFPVPEFVFLPQSLGFNSSTPSACRTNKNIWLVIVGFLNHGLATADFFNKSLLSAEFLTMKHWKVAYETLKL